MDAKFGIYTHWGVYAVPACGPNGTWYPYNMYRPDRALGDSYGVARQRNPQYAYHVAHYGGPERFGYKDFIPLFTAEHFDPDEWAALFKAAGARFAGPVGEHHDGFTMWDTQLSAWNAVRMGPRRDVVGELERAIRAQDMRFMVALHHAENWWFYPHWVREYDSADPRYAGLYGPPHNMDGNFGRLREPGDTTWPFYDQEPPSRAFLDLWKAKTLEVIDRYRPDLLWFDAGLGRIQEQYKQEFLAHYYNRALEWGREVVVTYKNHNLVPGSGTVDLELGRFDSLTYHDWITDTTVDDQGAWSYVQEAGYKPAGVLVHHLIDNVSKNGYLLLNVGPRADGTIPAAARDCLLGIGAWLAVNGEAIYDTTPWMYAGEGPTRLATDGPFSEVREVQYTARDIRFTVKGNALYAICLGWPGAELTIQALGNAQTGLNALYESEIQSVSLLGVEGTLDWRMTENGLAIQCPEQRPCEHAYAFKILRGRTL